MPYEVIKQGEQFCVVTKTTLKNHGCHTTRDEAEAQLRALYANTDPSREKKKPKPKGGGNLGY